MIKIKTESNENNKKRKKKKIVKSNNDDNNYDDEEKENNLGSVVKIEKSNDQSVHNCNKFDTYV